MVSFKKETWRGVERSHVEGHDDASWTTVLEKIHSTIEFAVRTGLALAMSRSAIRILVITEMYGRASFGVLMLMTPFLFYMRLMKGCC